MSVKKSFCFVLMFNGRRIPWNVKYIYQNVHDPPLPRGEGLKGNGELHLLFFRFRQEKYNFLRKFFFALLNSALPFILSVILYLWIRIHGPKWIRIRPDPDPHHCLKYWPRSVCVFFPDLSGSTSWYPRGLLSLSTRFTLYRVIYYSFIVFVSESRKCVVQHILSDTAAVYNLVARFIN